ncbi:MAG: polyamine aminopropyltransferase [Armatimonadetes bacterium]|nr:polyamine aminopropyltransferase [Armatimonadota bacterium]
MTSELLTFPIRGRKLSMSVEVRKTLFREQSAFQEIEIIDTEVFGRALLLDRHIQLTELDEEAYHECLVDIPMLSLSAPKRALIVGGGDGGVLRQLCRHSSLERIDMVEIDQMVIDACEKHFPISKGAFQDKRLSLHVEDAFQFVKRAEQPYDLIVMDSTDTYEGEDGALSEQLFTESFYRDCARLLKPEGLLVTQADNLLFCPYSLDEIRAQYGRVFPHVQSYWGIVPSFGGFSGFCVASHGVKLAASPDFGRVKLTYLNTQTYNLAFQPLPFAKL